MVRGLTPFAVVAAAHLFSLAFPVTVGETVESEAVVVVAAAAFVLAFDAEAAGNIAPSEAVVVADASSPRSVQSFVLASSETVAAVSEEAVFEVAERLVKLYSSSPSKMEQRY